MAWDIGSFGGEENFLEANARAAKLMEQMLVDIFHIGQREVATPDAGLIGHDKQLKASVLQTLQSSGSARENDNLIGLSKVMPVLDDRPVAVQENSLVHIQALGELLTNRPRKGNAKNRISQTGKGNLATDGTDFTESKFDFP